MSRNERIAKAKGWVRDYDSDIELICWRRDGRWETDLPNWEHDIGAAMALLEELRARGWLIELSLFPANYGDMCWVDAYMDAEKEHPHVKALTYACLPAAICDVWLEIMEAGKDE